LSLPHREKCYYDVLETTIFNPSHLSKWLPSSQKER